MNFRSDNVTGAAPEILAALVAANTGALASYGADDLTKQVEAKLKEIFETDLAAFPVATGTAANALVSLGLSPAEITWRAGVDILSFGATKNGALAAEVVVMFDKARAQEFAFRRKRAGHLFSKMRFLSAQLAAYLADDLWLRNA